MQAWRNQLKLLAMQRVQSLEKEEVFSFSVVVSGAQTLDNKIRGRFLDLLKELQKDVEASPPEKVMQINLEMIPWA